MQSATQRTLFVEVAPDFFEFHGETFEDHVDCWHIVDGQVQKDKWKLSAVAASLDVRYKDETVKRFAYEARRSARRVREYAQTWKAFQNGERSPILSFHHHTVAARHDDPVKAIHIAEDKEWSSRELEHWIKTGEEPKPKGENKPALSLKPGPEMQKLHDDLVRAELDERLAVVKGWTEPISPLLATVYGRIEEILDWQRKRTIARDCEAILKLFSGDVGTEAPERASDADIAAWLYSRGYIMNAEELGHAGNPEEKLEPSGRLGLMLKLKMLVVQSREGSRQDGRKGAIPAVYAVERDYMEWLDGLADQTPSDRKEATRKDWAKRIQRYAPELAGTLTNNEAESQAA